MMEQTRKSRAAAWQSALAAGIAAVALGLLAAAPAQAGNEFENGFEDQIGRLLAYEVFHIGRTVLHGGYAQRHAAHYDRRGHRYGHPEHPRRVIRPPRVHPHRHHHPGHREPCYVDHRRDRHRYDDHVVYERYEYERKRPRRGHWRF